MFPGVHLGVEGVFEALVFGEEVGALGGAGGEEGLLFGNLGLKGLYFFLYLLDGGAELAEFALAVLALLVGGLGGLLGGKTSGTSRTSATSGTSQSRLAALHKLEDVAAELVDGAVAELVEGLGEALKEVAVVADDPEATRCTYYVRYNTGDTLSGITCHTQYPSHKVSGIIDFFNHWLKN